MSDFQIGEGYPVRRRNLSTAPLFVFLTFSIPPAALFGPELILRAIFGDDAVISVADNNDEAEIEANDDDVAQSELADCDSNTEDDRCAVEEPTSRNREYSGAFRLTTSFVTKPGARHEDAELTETTPITHDAAATEGL